MATDGSGDFRTLKEAFAKVPDNNTVRVIIKIKPGVYVGQAILTRSKHKVTLQGGNAATTPLSFGANVYEQPEGTDSFYKGHGVVIGSNDFKADKLTFENTAANTLAATRYGYVFINSKLTSDPKPWADPEGTTAPPTVTRTPQAYLGRPLQA